MGGRLYSGNLNAFKAVCNKLYQLDFAVIVTEFYDAMHMKECMNLRVEDRAGRILSGNEFAHHDIDVLYNTCTAWLNGLYDQLKDWK